MLGSALSIQSLITGQFKCVVMSARCFSSVQITKNLTLYTKENKKFHPQTYSVKNEQEKPLVIILPWLMAKRNHIFKFVDIYLKQNFDVITATITPWQLLWPRRGSQVIAGNLVKFLDFNQSYSPLLIHGFSVGGYLWSESLILLAADQSRYSHVINRFKGQIWDSAADMNVIPVGFPLAMFPKNKFLRTTFTNYINYHLKTFEKAATIHYNKGHDAFFNSVIKTPSLLLLSKTDPVGTEKENLELRKAWEGLGMDVSWKCWDRSPHVCHFHYHTQEYMDEVVNFYKKLGFHWREEDAIQLTSKL